MKRLLIIGYVWPEPNSSAAGSRMLQLIECFQHDGYTVSYASPAQASDHAIDFEAFNITPYTIELNNSSFDQFIQTLDPQAVMFDRYMMEEQFAWRVETHCPNALRILDTEDLHCLRFARQALAKGNSDIIQDVPTEDLYSDFAKREIAAILRCDLSIMISEHEMNLLIKAFHVPAHILSYTPFMLEEIESKPSLSFKDRHHFISIGNFRHEPNWDAVLTLKQHIWPAIRKRIPKAQLHIYGAYPPKKATQLHNEKQGFLVKGWCEDAFAVLEQAKVLLAPLRFGAGLKGKMLDAAQCGLPAVTTSIGAEGLYADSINIGTLDTCIASDTLEQFIEDAINLYENESLWCELQNNCSPWLADRFMKTEHSQKLLSNVRHILNNLEQHRLENFTGSMLRHHSMKSTKYMSQWIEAKNKHIEITE
jgi:glycosyltransferase involved in cell wall biosynthesis